MSSGPQWGTQFRALRFMFDSRYRADPYPLYADIRRRSGSHTSTTTVKSTEASSSARTMKAAQAAPQMLSEVTQLTCHSSSPGWC